MTATDLHPEARREARLAAMLAAREQAPTYGPEEAIPLADVRPGDLLVKVPTQDRVRGVRYESVVTNVLHVHAGQMVNGCRATGTGWVLETGRHGEATWGSSIHRTHHQAVVRRVER